MVRGPRDTDRKRRVRVPPSAPGCSARDCRRGRCGTRRGCASVHRSALRRRRRVLGLTQEAAARVLGMSRLSYHRIETGNAAHSFHRARGDLRCFQLPHRRARAGRAARQRVHSMRRRRSSARRRDDRPCRALFTATAPNSPAIPLPANSAGPSQAIQLQHVFTAARSYSRTDEGFSLISGNWHG